MKLSKQNRAIHFLRLTGIIFLTGILMNLSACANLKTWQEEVKLNDGRTIVVTQKRRCESAYTGGDFADCIEREAWLMVKLPEFGNQEIVWHENLKPKVLNLEKGNLFIVGMPPTWVEFDKYGRPNPIYIGFKYESGNWMRISFDQIPEAIYDTNLVIDGGLLTTKYLTLEKKNSRDVNGNMGYPKYIRRIDPTFKSNLN